VDERAASDFLARLGGELKVTEPSCLPKNFYLTAIKLIDVSATPKEKLLQLPVVFAASLAFDLLGTETKKGAFNSLEVGLRRDVRFIDLRESLNDVFAPAQLLDIRQDCADRGGLGGCIPLDMLPTRNLPHMIDKEVYETAEFYIGQTNAAQGSFLPGDELIYFHRRRNNDITRHRSDNIVLIKLPSIQSRIYIMPETFNSRALNEGQYNDKKFGPERTTLVLRNGKVEVEKIGERFENTLLEEEEKGTTHGDKSLSKAIPVTLDFYLLVALKPLSDEERTQLLDDQRKLGEGDHDEEMKLQGRQLDEERVIERSASLVMVASLTSDDKYVELFAENASNMVLDLGETLESMGVKVKDDLKDDLEKVRSAGYVFDNFCKESKNSSKFFTSLRAFMASMAWLIAAKPLRVNASKSVICDRRDVYKDRRLDDKGFLDAVFDLRNYLMRYSLVLFASSGEKWKELWNGSVERQGAGWVLKDQSFLSQLAAKVLFSSMEIWEFQFSDIAPFASRIAETAKLSMDNFALVFKNWVIFILPPDSINEKDDAIDLFALGMRWLKPWIVLLLAMSSILSEVFLIYEESLDAYLLGGERNFNELSSLSRNAALDFSDFYDIEVLSTPPFRELFEYLKEESLINGLHDELVGRLELFSSREASETEHSISYILLFFTVGSLSILMTQLLDYNSNLPLAGPLAVPAFYATLVITGLLGVIVIRYFQGKIWRHLQRFLRNVKCELVKVVSWLKSPTSQTKKNAKTQKNV